MPTTMRSVVLFVLGMFVGMAVLCMALYLSTDIQEIARYGMKQYLDGAMLAGIGALFLSLYLVLRDKPASTSAR